MSDPTALFTGDHVEGHVLTFYENGAGQIRTKAVVVKLPAATMATDLRQKTYEPAIAKKMNDDGFTVRWMAPWRVGTYKQAANPIETTAHVRVEAVAKTGDDRRIRTIVVSMNLSNIEYWVWHRDDLERQAREEVEVNFVVKSIAGLSLGPYISFQEPVEDLEDL